MSSRGYLVRCVSGHPQNRDDGFAAIWFKLPGGQGARHGCSPAAFQQDLKLARQTGKRPESVSGYPAGPSYLLAIAFVPDAKEMWEVQTGLTVAQLKESENGWRSRGYSP